MSQQFQGPGPALLFVRFEQGRGKGGVPKTWVPYSATDKKPAIETLIRVAVAHFRALCADPNLGHGRDLMPGRDDEYMLHHVDGSLLKSADEIKWETVNGQQRAELVLTWRLPSECLLGLSQGGRDG